MRITMHLYDTGSGDNARRFAMEMEQSGIADQVRAEPGNERYEYFFPMNDPQTVLLIDSWSDQRAGSTSRISHDADDRDTSGEI